MSLEENKGCGCSDHGSDSCGCEHTHEEAHACECGSEGCGCGDEQQQATITLTLTDDSELVCPVIDSFNINDQTYVALLHPEDETVMLYRIYDNDDGTLDIEPISDDYEFEVVSKTFLSLHE